MSGFCTADPQSWVGAALVVVAALAALVGPVTALALRVLQNTRDVQAAWDKLRVHEKALNGAVKAAERGGGR